MDCGVDVKLILVSMFLYFCVDAQIMGIPVAGHLAAFIIQKY